MNVRGYETTGEWKSSTGGETVFAIKNGKKYFLKKYNSVGLLLKSTLNSDKMVEDSKIEYEKFVKRREKLIVDLQKVAYSGGNIISPMEWFSWLEDGRNRYVHVEVTEAVDDIVEDISKLDDKQIALVLKTIAGELDTIHRQHIVHGDLTMDNIITAKNSAGNYVAKIIDFGCCYYMDDVPRQEIGGTDEYLSPELGLYIQSEMDEEYIECIGTKSDIFSLGIIFHQYLSGEFPGYRIDGEDEGNMYVWEALSCGGKIVISPKIKDTAYRNLICDMLQFQPDDRPSAGEVLIRLKEVGKVKSVEPEVIPQKTFLKSSFDTTWKEHNIIFLEDIISRFGYTDVKRVERNGVKCYELSKPDGPGRIVTAETALMMGLAVKSDFSDAKYEMGKVAAKSEEKPVSETEGVKFYTESFWEKDTGYKFNTSLIKRLGCSKIVRCISNDVKCYALLNLDGTCRKISSLGDFEMTGFVEKI